MRLPRLNRIRMVSAETMVRTLFGDSNTAAQAVVPDTKAAQFSAIAGFALSGAGKVSALFVRILGRKTVFACLFLGVSCSMVAQGCPVDRPCFVSAYQACHTVNFDFSGIKDWDFYNLRYPVSGGGERQVENRSGKYTINNARPAATYTIKVQGCSSRTLRSSKCSPWVQESVTTVTDYGPDTCRPSLVWRDASPNDHVCVLPRERDQVASQNASASSKRQPGGGAYGPDTCRQPYVWRDAFPGDHVCVSVPERDTARNQNRLASKGRLCP